MRFIAFDNQINQEMLIDFDLSLKLFFCDSQDIDVPITRTVGVFSTLKDRFRKNRV